MIITDNLEGRIQCLDEDFVCINLHFRSHLDISRTFITQILINKKSHNWYLPIFSVALPSGLHFDNISLKDEIQSIVNLYFDICNKLS